MADLLFMLGTALFFIVSRGFVAFCVRLLEENP